jgi:hypothetical protein
MDFMSIVNNVLVWSNDRGILEHGTSRKQLYKALSEVGELADGIAKGSLDEMADALGDIAVCLVNANALLEAPPLLQPVRVQTSDTDRHFSDLLYLLSTALCPGQEVLRQGEDKTAVYIGRLFSFALQELHNISECNGLNFFECCETAWHEIKDRKGYLTADGVFVKEG